MKRRGVLLAVAIGAAACGAGSESSDGAASSDRPAGDSARMAQYRVELIEADREFLAAVRTRGLGAWLQAFAPDGMMISGGASHAGQEGIRQAVLPLFADPLFDITWDPQLSAVSASGDLGYTVGTYEMTAEGEAGAAEFRGTYLTVWRRQPDGTWKVEADIGNPGE
ncbi:MAG: YybH family protein [Gemmatimonadota bacterium]